MPHEVTLLAQVVMIPREFHFIYGLKEQSTPFLLPFALAVLSCAKVNKPKRIHFYYHHEPYGHWWDSIRHLLTLHKVTPPKRFHGIQISHYAHQADILRLQILIAQGGVYADIDTLFVNTLPDELFDKPFVMGLQRQDNLCNAFMMSQPKSIFASCWLEDHKYCFTGGEPGTLGWDHHSVHYPFILAKRRPKQIHIEPQASFFKHLFDLAGVKALFAETDADLEDVYSFHLWESCTRDVLGQITPESIMSTDTTYNVIARKFLNEI